MDDTLPRPVLNQVNLVVQDWPATLAFYRLLGVDVSDGGEYPPGSGARHTSTLLTADRMTLEFDNPAMVSRYAREAAGAIRGPLVGFAYPTSAAVDDAYARVVGAGHTSHQAPYDAFWGARYAVVQDPDGTAVGLMGPISDTRSD
ncbi:MAG TPA: VOC family protein [Chloroflexota bacterium]